jgi:hypothetical protein
MLLYQGGENIPRRFILAGPFVMIAKPEIAKGSILKRFSLSCLKFQRINQDKKQSYFAGTAAENEDNCLPIPRSALQPNS